MPEGEESHSQEPGRSAGGLAAAVAIVVIVLEVLLAGVLVAVTLVPDEVPPASVPPPTFPTPVALGSDVPGPIPGGARPPGRAAIGRCLAPVVNDPTFGPRLAVAVATTAGKTLYLSGPDAVTPASSIKLFTTSAALAVLGPTSRFTTTSRISADGRTLALVGGGDPLLARSKADAVVPGAATLTDLAGRTAKQLKGFAGHRRLRLVVDSSLFTGPAVDPAWEPNYIPDDVVSPISALWVDEGELRPGSFQRASDPAVAAGRVFAGLLRKQGVKVRWAGHARAGQGFTDLASVSGPTLLDTVRHVLEVSDNEGAEVLARQVALKLGDAPSFSGATAAVPEVLASLGVKVSGLRMLDASGLSREDLVPVPAYLSLMQLLVATPALRAVLVDLPVSGFSGTLEYRYDTLPRIAHGTVHGKTGTLTGVDAIVGYVVTRDGAPLLFVSVADRVPDLGTTVARDGLARISSALAGCRA